MKLLLLHVHWWALLSELPPEQGVRRCSTAGRLQGLCRGLTNQNRSQDRFFQSLIKSDSGSHQNRILVHVIMSVYGGMDTRN